MSFRIKPGVEIVSRVILTIIVLFNAAVPTVALALPAATEESIPQEAAEPGNSLPSSPPVSNIPNIVLSEEARFSPNPDEEPKTPEKDPIEFSIATSNGEVKNNRSITINVVIRNNSKSKIDNLVFYDKLEDDFSYDGSSSEGVGYNFFTSTVNNNLETLEVGGEAAFSYVLIAENSKNNKLLIHNAEIEYDLPNGETRAQTTSMGVADNSSLVSEDALIILPDQAGDGWDSAGRYSLYLGDEVLSQEAVVLISPTTISDDGPELQFNLDLIQTTAPSLTSSGELVEQDISLTKKVETDFESPAYLKINLDGVGDLTDIPGDQEPYVVTYDEDSNVWVKVPIVETDPATNSVTVEAAHFSTWGAGLGNSLPKNGANVLLFDQPYTSLFTGASRYSIPIWTPPGRTGMAPDISLSYSSATVDGVLGDVQAPWVGVGWNIDGIEIVRKITTNENGYGYSNNFALTLNGTVYELLVDPNNPKRFYTKQGSFLFIERHNFALGNAAIKNTETGSTETVNNTTGEWWEVVSTDGTNYRLGWDEKSEQVALMYGYGCNVGNPCQTPDGAYATLGYAGVANDLVALRWRVDKITDTHGNTITYSYTESQPSGATTLAPFDRESYLSTISYTGFENPEDGLTGNLDPGYQVEFFTKPRSEYGDVPTTFNIWDNLDNEYLDEIRIKCLLCGTSNQLIRTYDLNYSLATVPNADGTLILTDIKIKGANFSEGGQNIPVLEAPTIKFTYQNSDNRNITGTSNDKYTYPRLQVINNGTGGLLTYTYETDGRGINSWYNYRVKEVRVEGGLGTAALQSYTYTTPIYTNVGGADLGDLIGYTTTSEKQLDYINANAVILETKHSFGTQGLDTGYELKTEWLSGATVLRKTTNTYVTDNTKAPFSGWNYRYLYQTINYVNNGGSLLVASKVVYIRDPGTGNLLAQTDFLGTSPYRKTLYEYFTNFSAYILDKASRVLVTDASNNTLSDTWYHYDEKRNKAPTYGDLTLIQSLTGSEQIENQVVNTVAHFDIYGNVTQKITYDLYGILDVDPIEGAQETTIAYDDEYFFTYPVTQTNPLGESSSTSYLFRLGIPYQTTDANGWVTTTTYDSLGRQLSIQVPGVEDDAVHYNYPALNGSGTITAPYSVEMQILDSPAGVYRSVWGIYDGLGRQIQMQVHDGDENELLVTDTEFNPQGAVARQSSPYYVNAGGGYYVPSTGAQFTTSLYDALGRVTQVTQPGDFITLTSYDGFVTTISDPKGQVTERVTDGLGRLTTVREFSDSNTVYATTHYANDEMNRVASVTDAQGNVTILEYDWLGRKISMDDPDMGKWYYQYNPTGTLYKQIDARTKALTFGYDDLNRLTSKTGNDVNTEYTYGDAPGSYGFRIEMSDGSGVTTWNYPQEAFGRRVEETRALHGQPPQEAQTLITTSDWLGRPLSVTYPDGEVLTYAYDALGRPDTLDSNEITTSTGLLVDLTYNVLGQVTSQALGNGVTITNTYNSINNRLDSRISPDLINFEYSYDNVGNIIGITDSILNETHTYDYDFLNRLTSAEAVTTNTESDYKYRQEFTYNKVGNITEMNDWVTPTPQPPSNGFLDSSPSHAMFAPVSYRSPQLDNPISFMGSFLAPARQGEDTETPTPTSTSTDTPTQTDTPTSTYTPSPTYTRTPSPTNTRVPTNTSASTPTPTYTPWSGADGFTSSMLHLNGVDASTSIIDETGKVWTVTGNAQIDTAQSKFGGASALFDGTGDFLSTVDQSSFQLAANDFTIDFWVRFNSLPSNGAIKTFVEKGDATGRSDYWFYLKNNAGTYEYHLETWNSAVRLVNFSVASSGLSTGVWYHVALVRNGSSFYVFQDGTQAGSTQTDADALYNNTYPLHIGSVLWSSSYAIDGHIDEFRLSKGIARWTSNFTPPAEAFGYGPEPTATATSTPSVTPTPTKTGTATATYTPSRTATPYTISPTPTPQMGNLMAYWSFEGVSGTTVNDEALGDVTNNSATLYNNPAIQLSGVGLTAPPTPGVQGYSVSFDGSNDYASIADQAEIKNNGSFTISAWVNPASIVTNRTQYILQKGGANKDYGFITVSTQGTATPTANPGNTNANGSIAFQVGDLTPNTLFGPILPINTWTMVTGVYDSAAGRMRLYLNGELVASQAVTGTVSMSTTALTFSSSAAANVYNGSLDEVRFYNRALTEQEVGSVYGFHATATPTSSSTPTPHTQTPTPTGSQPPVLTVMPDNLQPWGTGLDGNLTIAANTTFNINTNTSNDRTCADGIAYSVTQLGSSAATLDNVINPTATALPAGTATPSSPSIANCLAIGDEVLLIQLAGDSVASYNAGSYEYLRVASVNGSTVNFSTSKTKWYGSGWRSDLNIGTGTGQIRVMLMRVPNYDNLEINGTLTSTGWNSLKYGVIPFRVKGTLDGSGIISANGLGYHGGGDGLVPPASTYYGESMAGHVANAGGGKPASSGWQCWHLAGGGGAYGTNGSIGGDNSAGGTAYGNVPLSSVFFGAGGGAGGFSNDTDEPCGDGHNGGGIVLIGAQTLDFDGTISTSGGYGSGVGGGGAGGTVRIEAGSLGGVNIDAQGNGNAGVGRVAVYYQGTPTGLISVPVAYTAILGQPPTATPTKTPIGVTNDTLYGDGKDGDLTVTGTFNINTDNSNTRICSGGGDAVTYTITSFTDTTAKLTTAPVNNSSSSCLVAGDEVMLMNAATGNYEFLRVGGVIGDTVYFRTAKTKFFGSNGTDDANMGTNVKMIRVPNYNNVTVSGTLTGSSKSIIAFRVKGSLSGDGVISANSLGYYGGVAGSTYNGEGMGAGYSAQSAGSSCGSLQGGGGGYGTAGSTGSQGATGGNAYGDSQLATIFWGSGGGSGGGVRQTGDPCGNGGNGGGIVFIGAKTIDFTGTISSNGANGSIVAGGGSGGSIRIDGGTVSLNTVSVAGGGNGGYGRIAVYYSYPTLTSNLTANAYTYLQHVDLASTPTPTASPTEISYDGYTRALLHADGTDASTSFVDATGKVWTASGNAQIDTAQYKFGDASALFDGSGDYLSSPDNDDWQLDGGANTNTWTIDFRVRFNADPGTASQAFVQQYENTSNYWVAYLYNNNLRFRLRSGGTDTVLIDRPWDPAANTWYHIAVVKNGTTGYQLFVDGIQLGATLSDSDTSPNFPGEIRIGLYTDASGGASYLNGWMDEIRISKGVARWTANFTPPTTPYYGNYTSITPTATAGWQLKTYNYAGTNFNGTPYPQPHAVTSVTVGMDMPGMYQYDENGNMTCRVEGGVTYKQEYNVENRISAIHKMNGTCETGTLIESWVFVYDGDGTRINTTHFTGLTLDSTTLYYFGGAYETHSDGAIFKYYSFGGQSIVNEKSTATNNEWKISYLLADHLGSIVAVTNGTGTLISQQRYLPFGGERNTIGSIPQTDYGYTGQRLLDEGIGGLMDYKFRFYSPLLNRFIQPDTIAPGGPQGLNRYSYANNSPINFTDPTGHVGCEAGKRCPLRDLNHSSPVTPISTATVIPTSIPTLTASNNFEDIELISGLGSYAANEENIYLSTLSQTEIEENMSLVLKETQNYSNLTKEEIAYIFASIHWESHWGFWMEELSSGGQYEGRTDLGNVLPGDGPLYKGRGFIQLTGRANYNMMSSVFGIDLINEPSLAAQRNVSARITVYGMVNGSFTGRKLSDFGSSNGYDFVGARSIVNSDNGQVIAQIAQDYLKILSGAP